MPSTAEVRQRIEPIKDKKYRLCFMYQYLIAGRISEVCGKYAPRGFEALEVEFISDEETYSAVLFAVKTAKRKSKRGWTLRPVALPLNPEYEPWSQALLDHFKKAGHDYPFMFADKTKTSKRYAQWTAEKAFKGLEWNMEGYSKPIEVEVKREQIIREGINQRNQEVYLIELENGTSKWFTKIREGVIRDHTPIYTRWNPFRSHCLRKRRSLDLELFYGFNGLDLKAYGGWEEKGKESHITDAMKYYLHLDIEEARENIEILKQIANKYFHKLLIPIEKIIG